MKQFCGLIGLTGGIGAGKSAAAARFAALGAFLIDADVLARKALDVDGICYDAVVDAFTSDILLKDGRIDRRKLADIVFSDEAQRRRLNDIVHPGVISYMLETGRRMTRADGNAIVVLDVPLLFECGMEKDVDASVLVYTDDEKRIARIIARDGCTQEEACARIRAQMPQEKKLLLADYVVRNNASLEALYGQIDALYQIFWSNRR